MSISEQVKGLSEFVEIGRHANGGSLNLLEAEHIVNELYDIRKQLLILESCAALNRGPGRAQNTIKQTLDNKLLATGGAIKKTSKLSVLDCLIKPFIRPSRGTRT
tara:strand:+ start:6957 stop:7271 length:315 start_codon:yes stop_codon:yes gene_type:complete